MGPREHVGDAELWSLGWMPFKKRVQFFGAMHVFKVKQLRAPAYLTNCFKRIHDVHSYGLRQSELNFSLVECPFPPRSFTRNAISFWNALPYQLKLAESYRVFRKGLSRI